MFIRKTSHSEKKNQKKYSTFKLVESIRTEKGPQQRTLLNLGANFTLDKTQWKYLAELIDQTVKGQIVVTLRFRGN